MKSEDPFGLRPLWDASLEIYREIAKICDRHGLRYYVTDGTALGAVRHKGFIPWDDDFDISMPRPDYEKIKKIFRAELPAYLKFVDFHNTPEFGYLFGKVQDCRREKIEALEKDIGSQLSNGLSIDIFPIEGYPKSRFVGKAICFLSRLFGRVARTRGGWRYIGMRGCEMLAKMFPFEKSDLTGRTCSALSVYRRAGLARLAWGTPVKMEFDRGAVPVPSDVGAYLKNEYGDYMKLPPKEKRHPTHGYAKRCPWWLGPTAKDKV